MTRKHFKALAEALRFRRPLPPAAFAETATTYGRIVGQYVQWEIDVKEVADACARFNNNFDRSRFYRAAGLEEQ